MVTTCHERLLGIVCDLSLHHGSTHTGATATANGGSLRVTWTYTPAPFALGQIEVLPSPESVRAMLDKEDE